jgi:hypothetical protein
LDATFYDGAKYLDLSGKNSQVTSYNVQRVLSNNTWVYVVKGLASDGLIHFRFFPNGSRILWSDGSQTWIICSQPSMGLCSDFTVSPRTGVYPVGVYVAEIKQYVGNAQCTTNNCLFTFYTSDPEFTVTVTDGAGYAYNLITGLSLTPPPQLAGLASQLTKIMDFKGLGVSPVDFLILLVVLAVMWAGFTYLNWELAILVGGFLLMFLSALLGGSGALVFSGISLILFGAIISYIIRRV